LDCEEEKFAVGQKIHCLFIAQ